MIEIAVCDDEAVIRGQLQQFIKKSVPESCIEVYATGEGLLATDPGNNFYRCHRRYLVNLAYIAEYRTDRIRLSRRVP